MALLLMRHLSPSFVGRKSIEYFSALYEHTTSEFLICIDISAGDAKSLWEWNATHEARRPLPATLSSHALPIS